MGSALAESVHGEAGGVAGHGLGGGAESTEDVASLELTRSGADRVACVSAVSIATRAAVRAAPDHHLGLIARPRVDDLEVDRATLFEPDVGPIDVEVF